MGGTAIAYSSGSSRAIEPTTLLSGVTPLLAPAGITRLANITGLDRIGIPTFSAIRPGASTLSVSAGKGVTVDDARASAAMEALEFFSAEITSFVECCSARDLTARALYITDALPLRRHAIVRPADPIRWTFGVDLVDGEQCAVPADVVTLAKPPDPLSPFLQTSNGLASGAIFVEALLAGLLEVVERDACAVWRMAGTLRGRELRRVRLETITDMPVVADLLDRLAHAQIQAVVYDCTGDVRVPCYLTRLIDLARRNVGVFFGSGAHLDPGIALVRALTEAAQSRAVYIAGSRDDLSGREFAQLRAHDSPSVITNLLALPATVDARRAEFCGPAFEDHIEYIVARLTEIGIEHVVVVDLTPAAFRDTVVVLRVVAPGLGGPGVANASVKSRAEA